MFCYRTLPCENSLCLLYIGFPRSLCINTSFLYYSVTTFLVGFMDYSEKNAKALASTDFANEHAVDGSCGKTVAIRSRLTLLMGREVFRTTKSRQLARGLHLTAFMEPRVLPGGSECTAGEILTCRGAYSEFHHELLAAILAARWRAWMSCVCLATNQVRRRT